MDNRPIYVIDNAAKEISEYLDGFVFSVEGLFEKYSRENPTMNGFRFFINSANLVLENSLDATVDKIINTTVILKAYQSESEQLFLTSTDDLESLRLLAYRAIGSFLQQVVIALAKKFRAIVASRAFQYDTYNPSPKMITSQSGKKWNFTDFAYLTVRQLLVDWYNQSKISYMASVGIKEFTLDTLSEELLDQKYLIEDFPNLTEKLFHPRTTKLVGVNLNV